MSINPVAGPSPSFWECAKYNAGEHPKTVAAWSTAAIVSTIGIALIAGLALASNPAGWAIGITILGISASTSVGALHQRLKTAPPQPKAQPSLFGKATAWVKNHPLKAAMIATVAMAILVAGYKWWTGSLQFPSKPNVPAPNIPPPNSSVPAGAPSLTERILTFATSTQALAALGVLSIGALCYAAKKINFAPLLPADGSPTQAQKNTARLGVFSIAAVGVAYFTSLISGYVAAPLLVSILPFTAYGPSRIVQFCKETPKHAIAIPAIFAGIEFGYYTNAIPKAAEWASNFPLFKKGSTSRKLLFLGAMGGCLYYNSSL